MKLLAKEPLKASFEHIYNSLRQPWLLSVLFIALIPIFPEYISIPLAIGSVWMASKDAKIRHQSLSVGTLGKLILLYIAYMAFGVLYSPNPLNSISTLLMWVVMFAVYMSMTTVLCSKHRFDTALFCIVLVAGIVGVIACGQYLLALLGSNTSMQFWGWIDRVLYEWFPMPLNLSDFGLRTSSTFNNPNIAAEYLVMILPFAVYYAFDGKRTRVRMLCRICLLAAVCGIAFTFSRGSYLALLAIVAVLCIANIRKITVIFMSAVSLLVLIPDTVMQRLFSIAGSDGSINERWSIWAVSIDGILESPIFGRGPGIQNSWDMLMAAGIDAPHTHNLVLELLVEGGVIALILMILVGWKMLRGGIRMVFQGDSESRMLGIAFIGFVAAFCTHSMVDFPLLSPKLVAVFLMIIAFADCARTLYMREKLQPMGALAPTFLRGRTPRNVYYSQHTPSHTPHNK